MSYLVGNPEDRFSRVVANMVTVIMYNSWMIFDYKGRITSYSKNIYKTLNLSI